MITKTAYQCDLEQQILFLISEKADYEQARLFHITKEDWDMVDSYQSILEDIEGELLVFCLIKETLF